MATNYTPLTAVDDINMAKLNSIFAELDSAISGGALTGTAGETLDERDFVYLASDGEWYQLDTNATGTVAAGALLGCVTESGGISTSSTGQIKLSGTVSGFTGLTAWARVYGSTVPGTYTQTRPNPSAGGGQVAIAELGYAINTTTIYLRFQPIVYLRRASLADDGTLTIEHHSDAQTRTRQARAYVATDLAGTVHAEYADSNQDDAINLRGPGTGDDITITTSGALSATIGDDSGTEYRESQTFTTVNGGTLTEISFTLGANVGSPTGDITWAIYATSGDDPTGAALTSGTHTPTPSAENIVTLSGGEQISLSATTKYALVLSCGAQATNSRYTWAAQTTSTYAGGEMRFSDDGGSSWTDPGNREATCSITISGAAENDKVAQSFQVTGTQEVATVKLWLKKSGSPTGTMTLRIETDNSGDPSGTLADANLTVDVAESSVGTSYADVTFTFATPANISGSTTYWIVLSTDRSNSISNYVTWGIDSSTPSYADGQLVSENSSSWSAESADGVFSVEGAGTAYDEELSIGSDTGAAAEMGVRFDDGAGSDEDTMTTFQNLTGATADILCAVVMG